jgi:hypothetical protein
MAGKEQRKQAVRRWKFEKPQLGQVQSPGRGRFFDGGKGVRSGGPPGGWEPAARSRTRDFDGAVIESTAVHAERFGGLGVGIVSDVTLGLVHCCSEV